MAQLENKSSHCFVFDMNRLLRCVVQPLRKERCVFWLWDNSALGLNV